VFADDYYAKTRVFETAEEAGCHLITKLRSDANLRYLYKGPQTGRRGAPKRYDGKVDWSELFHASSWWGSSLMTRRLRSTTQPLNSPHFGRNLQVVVLVDTQAEAYAVLGCSDPNLEAMKIVKYYHLRFQIKLIFRDAKQFTGLTHCQARSREKLHFHLNMSLTAVSLAQASMLSSKQKISMNDFVRRAYNRWLTGHLLFKLGLNSEFELNNPKIQQVIRMGSMAA
jgi:hypothetical protein